MTIDEIDVRLGEIDKILEQPEADLDALQEEVRSLNEERETLRKAAKEAEETRKAIAEGLGETKEHQEETKIMTNEEIRKSTEYVEAFAR